MIENSKILAASNQVAQACITSISKPERRSHTSGGHSHSHVHTHTTIHPVVVASTSSNTARIIDTLERTLSLYLFHGRRVLEHPSVTAKQRQNMMREISIDVVSY